MKNKEINECPRCKSNNIRKNGHIYCKNQQWLCKDCNKYFSENFVKGYPPSKIPFWFIAYILYLHKGMEKTMERKIPIKVFRKIVNNKAFAYGIVKPSDETKTIKELMKQKEGISRQTLHYWFNNYYDKIENIISKQKVDEQMKRVFNEMYKQKPINITEPNPYYVILSHKKKRELMIEKLGGEEAVRNCLKYNRDRFNNIWKLIDSIDINPDLI